MMLRTQDPADAGVTTALERARSLHDRVRAAANRAKANRRTTDGQELVALSFVRDKLALLEDKLREYRLLNAYDSQAKTAMLCQLDASRRELITTCREASVLLSGEQAPLIREVMAFCEMSHSEDSGATSSFADVVHRRPRVDGMYGESPSYVPQTTPEWEQPAAAASPHPAETANSVVGSARHGPSGPAMSEEEASESFGQYGGKLSLRPFAATGPARSDSTGASEDHGPRAVELLRDQYFPRFRHTGSPVKQHNADSRLQPLSPSFHQQAQAQQPQQPQHPAQRSQQHHLYQQQYLQQPQFQHLQSHPADHHSHPRSPGTPPVLDASTPQQLEHADKYSDVGDAGGAAGRRGGVLGAIGKVAKTAFTMAAVTMAGVAVAVVAGGADVEPGQRRKSNSSGSRRSSKQHLPMDAMEPSALLHQQAPMSHSKASAADPRRKSPSPPALMPQGPKPDIGTARG